MQHHQEVKQLPQDKIDYTFSTVNSIDCELIFPILIKNRLLKTMFRKELNKRKHEKQIKGEFEDIKEFKVPKVMHNVLKVQTKSLVQNACEDIEKDGVVRINYLELDDAFYRKEKDGSKWLVILKYTGSYVKL